MRRGLDGCSSGEGHRHAVEGEDRTDRTARRLRRDGQLDEHVRDSTGTGIGARHRRRRTPLLGGDIRTLSAVYGGPGFAWLAFGYNREAKLP